MTWRLPLTLLAGLMVCLGRPCSAGEMAQTDSKGRIRMLQYQDDLVALSTDLTVASPGWKVTNTLDDCWDVAYEPPEPQSHWAGTMWFGGPGRIRFEQAVKEDGGVVACTATVTAQQDLDLQGIYLDFHMPVGAFGGWTCRVNDTSVILPERAPAKPQFYSGRTGSLTLSDPASALRVAVNFDRAYPITLQDERVWHDNRYAVMVCIHEGPIRKGQSVSIRYSFKPTGNVEHAPVKLSLDPGQKRYRFEGFGGAFADAYDCAEARYNLDHLAVGSARVQMNLAAWEPANDDASPQTTNWDYFTKRVEADANLRKEFELQATLSKKGIPYSLSLWDCPSWMYVPGKAADETGQKIAPDKWPELLESIGTYLLYARDHYGAEPALFSFNEPDEGVHVAFSPEELRDAIKRTGAHLEKLGLKTKIAMPETALRRGYAFARPTVEDPEAMRYVGALSFHAWKTPPEEYPAWAELAGRTGLPLQVSEVGVDPNAWHDRSHKTFSYAIQELEMYQRLLLDARPQALLEWTYTWNFGFVLQRDLPGGKSDLLKTPRFWFLQQLTNLTPHPAEALATRSDNRKVLFTAFADPTSGACTLHIANLGPGRPATLTGLPASIQSLRAVGTSRGEPSQELAPIPVRDGHAELHLPALSLLTLSTRPPK